MHPLSVALRRSCIRILLFSLLLTLSLDVQSAPAVVTASGDVTPDPPENGGTVSGTLTVGTDAFGFLRIDGASELVDQRGVVGDEDDAVGRVQVTGFGSEWNHTDDL